MTENITTV